MNQIESNSERERQLSWWLAIRNYLAVMAVANLVWEAAQVPLYTIWIDKSWPKIAFAALHCTLGDLIIATIALIASILIFGNREWPMQRFPAVAIATVALGVAYTIYSEWINTQVLHSWAYRDIMPTLPFFGTGLSPLLQWIVIPTATFLVLHRKYQLKGAVLRSEHSR